MGKLTFYKDSASTFKCDLKIEGANLKESKARLLLMFENAPTILFNGSISSDGTCEVSVPALKEISSNNGTALLEVIADSTYFESWKSDFNLKNKKSVSIVSESVTVESASDKKAISVTVEGKNLLSTSTPPTIRSKTPSTQSIFVEQIDSRNKDMVKKFLHGYNSLTESKKKKLVREVKNFKFNKDTVRWAEQTFSSPDSTLAKYCMVRVQTKHK